MSETKRICTRIINKHAPATTWDAADCTFVPEVGELIIYEPAEAGAPARIKIGDGSTYENGEKKVVKDLPFVDHDYSGDISELNKALSDHEKDTTAHITATERSAWNDAKTHAASDHVAIGHKHSGADITSGTVSIDRLPTITVAKGGTGATTAADALKNLGLDATATELNYVQGVKSSIQSQLDGKAPASHNHDDRYYTEDEVDDLLAGKSDEHNHPYAPTGHNHVTSDVTALTGYAIAKEAAAIAATDSLNVALGKLQKTLDTKASSSMSGYSKASSASAIATTDTVLTAIGKLEKALDGKSDTHNHPYSPTGHTHASSDVTAMTGYSKANAASAIATTDSLNVAIGKLEKGLDGKASSVLTGYSKASSASALAATDTVIAAFGKLEKALDGKAAAHNHPYSPTGHTHASNEVTAMTGYTKASSAAAVATTDSLNTAIGKLERTLDDKANKADIATTVSVGSASSSATYYKIHDFGAWGTGDWTKKGFSMLLTSRGGEMVWVTLAANDSNTAAGAFRLVNRYSKITKIYYHVAESAIYVTCAAWANNLCAHMLTNVYGDYVPKVNTASAIPTDAVEIKIVEFGVNSTSAVVGNSAVTLELGGSADRPTYNSVDLALKSDVPTGGAASKNVDTSISAASTSTNLPTSKAVAAFAVAKSGDSMTGRLQLNMANPHIHMKDTGYSTDWYFQAYQDQLAFGPTFNTAVKTDKSGNMTVPGTVTVDNKVKLDYDATSECLNFVFV